jgi:5-methylcytosine-specific restriction protein A
MAVKPLHPCKRPGCLKLTATAYCDEHQPVIKDERRSAAKRGYTYAWDKARRMYLSRYPWCAECARQGRQQLAAVVDHIQPHKGDQRLFWDRSNWQSLCKSCHSAKTAREDGGFGNKEQTPPHPGKVFEAIGQNRAASFARKNFPDQISEGRR